jgi:hypothetical protein
LKPVPADLVNFQDDEATLFERAKAWHTSLSREKTKAATKLVIDNYTIVSRASAVLSVLNRMWLCLTLFGTANIYV